MGGARDIPPIELRCALLAKIGLCTYSEAMNMDLKELETLEHIAFTLHQIENGRQKTTSNN
jgi:hypothetical protein